MGTEVTILRLRPEEDQFRPEGGDTYFKRTRAWGEAKLGDRTVGFVVILDIRARLLSIRPDEGQVLVKADAQLIGNALVNEMALFVTRPIAHLLVPAEETERAEWMVTDADHVNGLLHRLKEHKTFSARVSAPIPRRLREVTEHLLSAAIENLRQINWTWNPTGNISRENVPALDLSTWEANRERFTEWTEDRETRERIARVFELCHTYSRLWPLAIQAVPATAIGAPDNAIVTIDRAALLVGPAAVGRLRETRDELVRTLPALVHELGTPRQKDALETAGRAQAHR